MSDVLVFIPKHELEFKKNYDDFISFAKNRLTLFAESEFKGQKGWQCDRWSWLTPRGVKKHILFGLGENSAHYKPFKQPYADFAKAYSRYKLSLNPSNSDGWFHGLKWLYRALVEQAQRNGYSNISLLDINNNVINRTEELIKTSGLSEGTKRNLGISLEQILSFIKVMCFKLDLQAWKNPFSQRIKTQNRLDEASLIVELDKCPSDYQMLQVAEAFHRAETPRQRYFTSLAVMLMCQPSRSIELNGLTIHSLQQSEIGRWFLMWHPSKGGTPVRKWIPKLLEEVVQQAFNRLVEISAPAREAAKFAYDNPDRLMIHDKCLNSNELSYDKQLTFDEFADAIGLNKGPARRGEKRGWRWTNSEWINNLLSELNGVPNWRKLIPKDYQLGHDNKLLKRLSSESGRGLDYKSTHPTIKFPTYKDLVNLIHHQYKTQNFPYYGGVPLWECICLLRDSEFNKKKPVRPFSWLLVNYEKISDAFGAYVDGSTSIFEDLNITDEDGSRLRLTTHQFRHWLNTKLMLSGEEDWLIAKWSGRADIKQNKAYDGRTPAQKSRLTKRIGHVGNSQNVMTLEKAGEMLAPFTTEFPPPPMVLHDLALPVSLTSLGIQREGVAQFTGLGYCVHNYAVVVN